MYITFFTYDEFTLYINVYIKTSKQKLVFKIFFLKYMLDIYYMIKIIIDSLYMTKKKKKRIAYTKLYKQEN